jgi:hypothetical protein
VPSGGNRATSAQEASRYITAVGEQFRGSPKVCVSATRPQKLFTERLFTDCFTHLRTGEAAADPQILMASLLADGLNLGLTRMAEACSIASLGQLAWTADWHIRDQTYALALRRLINQQQREPLAVMFGGGSASSSDGQFFRAGGFGRAASITNANYGDEPGVKFYTHLSDRYAPFHTKVIAATASEAAHVLDGLLYHGSIRPIADHRFPQRR